MITAMLMESRVNLRDSQNISGASQPNSVASILRNNWSRWGLVLERKNLKMKQLVQRNPSLKKPRDSNLSQNECLSGPKRVHEFEPLAQCTHICYFINQQFGISGHLETWIMPDRLQRGVVFFSVFSFLFFLRLETSPHLHFFWAGVLLGSSRKHWDKQIMTKRSLLAELNLL